MIRSRLACLKHILFAIVALVLLLCATEVGLRVARVWPGGSRTDATGQTALVDRAWQTHHRLRPLESWSGRNPDTDEEIALRTNSFGLRGDEPAVPKPPHVYRVLCLGDETTLAAEMPESATFPARLQRLLDRKTRLQVEVINAGVPGYCPLLSYLQVRHHLLGLQPDLLILNFDMGDVADDHRYRRHTEIGDDGVPLACSHPELLARDAARQQPQHEFLLLRWGLEHLGALSTSRRHPQDAADITAPGGRYAWIEDGGPDWNIYIRQAFAPLHHLARLSERMHVRFFVATYPVPWQVSSGASDGPGVRAEAGIPDGAVYRSREPFRELQEYLGDRGIRFCDASRTFAEHHQPERLYLRNARHFSEAGHEVYARVLAEFVLKNVPGVWQYESDRLPARGIPAASR